MVLGKFGPCLKEPVSQGPQRDKLRDRKTARKVPGISRPKPQPDSSPHRETGDHPIHG